MGRRVQGYQSLEVGGKVEMETSVSAMAPRTITPAQPWQERTDLSTTQAVAAAPLPSVKLSLSPTLRQALEEQAKHWQGIQDALKQMQRYPSWSEVAKAAAKERAAMLKKILEMMKQMLLGATPAQAKAMASQLKDIARELAALGASLNKGGAHGGSAQVLPLNSTVAMAEPVEAAASGAELSALPPEMVSNEHEQLEKEEDASPNNLGKFPATLLGTGVARAQQAQHVYAQYDEKYQSSHSRAGEHDGSLKALLKDARKLLQTLVHMIKNKLGPAKQDVQDCVQQLGRLSQYLDEAERGVGQEPGTQRGNEQDALLSADSTPPVLASGPSLDGANPGEAAAC